MIDGSTESGLVVAEYNACRQMIVKNIEIMEKLETFSVGASAAAAAFSIALIKADISDVSRSCLGTYATNAIFNTTPIHAPSLSAFVLGSAILPIIIVLFGFTRFWALDKTIGTYNRYIIGIERRHPDINLTSHYRRSRDSDMELPKLTLMETRYLLWCLLAIVYISYCLFVFSIPCVAISAVALVCLCASLLLIFQDRCTYLRTRRPRANP